MALKNSGTLSPKYRLMIYFAHSTLVMYSKTIISNEKMSVGDFMKQNRDVLNRVFNEGLSIMEYELSHHQMERASLVYLQAKHFPSSILETDVYVPGNFCGGIMLGKSSARNRDEFHIES